MIKGFQRILILFALFFLGCCQSDRQVVTITTSSGGTLQVRVELADTPTERATGLMFRENLPEGEGMLFVFPEETLGSFWMKDTQISLDIIFIKDGRIVDIIANTTPFSEELLTPVTTYLFTLEVPGGYASRNGVQIGDVVEIP